MLIGSSASRLVNIQRQTGFVLEATTVAASIAAENDLRVPSFIEVTIAGGTDGTGTVEVVGTDDSGSSLTEDLTFSRNGTRVTTSRFSTVTSFNTTSLADESTVPTIEARAVSADGTEQLIFKNLAQNIPVVLQVWGGGSWKVSLQGSMNQAMGVVLMDYYGTFIPQPGDLLTFIEDGQQWYVRDELEVRLGNSHAPHHHRLAVERRDT
jgi:hypothetical protein